MSNIPSRNEWLIKRDHNNFDKDYIQNLYVSRFLRMTSKMFEYKNLPSTIPQKDLEFILQTSGSVTITKVDNEYYAFRGNLGGIPNEYYHPTVSVVANPYLKFSKSLTIGKDCEVIINDILYQGLMPEIEHYSNLLAECDISFKFAAINIRVPSVISAPDGNTADSAKEFMKQIVDGSDIGIIVDDDFEKNLAVFNYADSSTSIVHLIELKQYIIGTFYNNLGIQSQFNMKREAINEAEALLSQDTLFPTIDDMLDMRKKCLDKVNKLYGLNIEVELSSVWKHLRETRNQAQRLQESEINANNSSVENHESEENGNSEE